MFCFIKSIICIFFFLGLAHCSFMPSSNVPKKPLCIHPYSNQQIEIIRDQPSLDCILYDGVHVFPVMHGSCDYLNDIHANSKFLKTTYQNIFICVRQQ